MISTDAPRITFPQSQYWIKVIGTCSEGVDLQHDVVDCVVRHIPQWDATTIQARLSAAGNYLALSLCCPIDSLEQLQQVTQELQAHPQVRMVL